MANSSAKVSAFTQRVREINAATLQDSYVKTIKETAIQHLFVTSPGQFQDLSENSMILHRCADNSTINIKTTRKNGSNILLLHLLLNAPNSALAFKQVPRVCRGCAGTLSPQHSASYGLSMDIHTISWMTI